VTDAGYVALSNAWPNLPATVKQRIAAPNTGHD